MPKSIEEATPKQSDAWELRTALLWLRNQYDVNTPEKAPNKKEVLGVIDDIIDRNQTTLGERDAFRFRLRRIKDRLSKKD